jgi:exopolysaccharide biosynthesis polyprenyl glycosylphosphotransferase
LRETRVQSVLAAPFAPRIWSSRTLFAVAGRICKALDLLILSGVAFVLLVLPRVGRVALLDARVSVRGILLALVCVVGWRFLLVWVGVYSPQRAASYVDYLFRCVIGLNLCTGVVAAVAVVHPLGVEVWGLAEAYWSVCLALMLTVRLGLLAYGGYVRPKLRPSRNLMIVGSGQRARQVYEEFKAHREWDYRLLGFVDSEPQSDFVPPEMVIGGIGDLETILMHTVVDEVVIALPVKSQYEAVEQSIGICQSLGIQAQYFTDFFGTAITKRHSSEGAHGVKLDVVHHDSRRYVKRVMDVVFSAVLIVLFLPVMLMVALAVKLTSAGPVLFRQERFGLNKRRFYMLKFRSMMVDAESRQAAIEHLNETSGPAFKIKNDPRVTPIGNFLRKFSLDELPQLFNVLMGQMSLVGPRPLPLRDVNRFSEAWIMRRFSVKPGITCLWQIGGRSNTDFDRWIALDLEYIDHWSLWLDWTILLKTVPAVVMSRGAS